MVTIYHNPRCTKSRQTLQLLQKNGIDPEVVLYLDNAPSRAELGALADKLGDETAGIVRNKEAEFKEAGLSKESSLGEQLDAIAKFPKLLERPIVVKGDKAAIGRPPENVLKIL